MRVLRLYHAFVAGLIAAPLSAQSRTETDALDPVRRCAVVRQADEETGAYAVRCAEDFIRRQGYTNVTGPSDTSLIASEGIEWEASRREWLARRHGSLQARAAGVCGPPAGFPFVVVFRSTDGRSARGVTLDARFGSLRVEHQEFDLEAITARRYGCRPIDAGT